MPISEEEREAIEQEMVSFLLHQAGCEFAKRFVAPRESRRRISFISYDLESEVGGALSQRLQAHDGLLEGFGEVEQAAVLLFSGPLQPARLLEILAELNTSERWRFGLSEPPVGWGGVYLSAEWKTAEGKWSSAMGFAPWEPMPPTRKANGLALGLWPGRQDLDYHDDDPHAVGFIDMSKDDLPTRKLFKMTNKNVENLLGGRANEFWRQVAFCFDDTLRDDVVDALELDL